MKFYEQLNEYMLQTNATVSSLAEACGLSESVISRYKNGKRMPYPASEQLKALAEGIEKLATEKGIEITGVLEKLTDSLDFVAYNTEVFASRFDELLKALDIHSADLAKKLQYDPSYISKIRSGKRKPSGVREFVSKLCTYILSYYQTEDDKQIISYLLECTVDDISSFDRLFFMLSQYLYDEVPKQHTETVDFLKALDNFDLNDYIKSIHFDELKVPTVPFHLPKAKNYYGIEGMKEAELIFEKATVLSKSKEPVFMCSDMPMDAFVDDEFPKKWMFGLAMMLKKGLQIQIIHHLNRPFHELMLGLEAWIPLYMTGQVSPYYLDHANTSAYRYMLYTSGAVALSGECIAGKEKNGKKYVTNNKKELEYYKKRSKDLLDKALPLMDIYREEHKKRFEKFLETMQSSKKTRHNRLSGLPLATLSEELIDEILKTTELEDRTQLEIKQFLKEERRSYVDILQENEITEIIPVLDRETFAKTPLAISFGALFLEEQVVYSYELYQNHLKATREFAKKNNRYHLIETDTLDFANIQIQIVGDEYALVTKTNLPIIHFVIRHPLLVDAMKNLVIPIKEENDKK